MRSFLGYFGLETGEKAWDALCWAAPYLLLLGTALLGLSFGVQWLFPLPLWVHGAAVLLALFYFFLFLARMRRSAEDAGTDEGADAGPPPDVRA